MDHLVFVTGPGTPSRAAASLGRAMDARQAGYSLTDDFAKLILASSADLAVLLDARETARAARWIGVREMLPVLPRVEPSMRAELFKKGWAIARLPEEATAVQPSVFFRFALRLYLVGRRPQLRLSWRLTDLGKKLARPLTQKLHGQDLGRGNALIQQWLKPLAAVLKQELKPTGPFAPDRVGKTMREGGIFMSVLALADFWPRLINVKALRKPALKFFRRKVRPGRVVARVNVYTKASLLDLVLELKDQREWPKKVNP